jgi:protein PhnA
MTPEEATPCPECKSPFGYSTGQLMMCPECSHEWNPADAQALTPGGLVVKDANGNPLQDGDSVVIVKNLPVKGYAKSIKIGTKIKGIRLVEGDHNIDCKVEGFGSMMLKSEFVKKA